jgi:hypothetical protein
MPRGKSLASGFGGRSKIGPERGETIKFSKIRNL